jgi:hypothetical protein
MPVAKPLLVVKLPRAREKGYKPLVRSTLTRVANAVIEEVKEMEKTSGRGVWPSTKGRYGRAKKPLQGISKHIGFRIERNTLYIYGKRTGKRKKRDFLFAHHQRPGSSSLLIVPKRARVLYVPLTKKADVLTPQEAAAKSSRHGGSLKEGVIIGGRFYFYDPARPAGTKNRLVEGWPDFVYLPRVRLPRRSLYDRRRIRTTVRNAAVGALKEQGIPKSRVIVKTTVH